MKNELETSVEEIKKDADVQRALKEAATVEPEEEPLRARVRDKLVIGTHVALLVVLGVVHQLIMLKFGFVFYDQYPLIKKLLISVAVAAVCLMILRLVEVFFLRRVGDMDYLYVYSLLA